MERDYVSRTVVLVTGSFNDRVQVKLKLTHFYVHGVSFAGSSKLSVLRSNVCTLEPKKSGLSFYT